MSRDDITKVNGTRSGSLASYFFMSGRVFFPSPSLPLRRALFVLASSIALPLFASSGPAVEAPTFSDTLTADQKAGIALNKLSPEQVAALNAEVKREISVARQGDAKGFASSFTHRRTPQERIAAGLNLLSTPELNRLDVIVAQQLTQPQPAVVSTLPIHSTATGAVETVTHRPQMHGEVSLTYGVGSGGSNFYGGSMVSTYEDPDKGFALTIGISQYRGNGYFGRPYLRDGYFRGDGLDYGYGPYGYGYGYGPLGYRGW